MKISYQWVLAAIIVLLIILVGAYALTNGKSTPATNATVTPAVTITPTATTVASPSVTPGTIVSATPVPTTIPTPTAKPTASGSNGVQLTSYGYYITYPPFSDNEVNVNPNYVKQGDFVYFSPTSATITKYTDLEEASESYDAVAIVHRSGDLSGTTHVSISAVYDGNIDDWSFVNPDGGSNADVTFAPGESEKTIGIFVWTDGDTESNVGHLILKINDVDGVDSIGSNNMFTLTVNTQSASPSPSTIPGNSIVQFASSSGTLIVGTNSAQDYHKLVEVDRTGGTSALPIVFTGIDGEDWSSAKASYYNGVAFASGSTTTYVDIFAKGGIGQTSKTVTLDLNDYTGYSTGAINSYTLTIEYES